MPSALHLTLPPSTPFPPTSSMACRFRAGFMVLTTAAAVTLFPFPMSSVVNKNWLVRLGTSTRSLSVQCSVPPPQATPWQTGKTAARANQADGVLNSPRRGGGEELATCPCSPTISAKFFRTSQPRAPTPTRRVDWACGVGNGNHSTEAASA